MWHRPPYQDLTVYKRTRITDTAEIGMVNRIRKYRQMAVRAVTAGCPRHFVAITGTRAHKKTVVKGSVSTTGYAKDGESSAIGISDQCGI